MTLFDLMNEETMIAKSYKTDIPFIDKPLDNGIELGQLVTITGEQEAGKTSLLNQLLSGLAKKEKCLYFSLEFNKRQLKKHFKKMLKDKIITPRALENITVITNDMCSGEIDELTGIINNKTNESLNFIGIDSTLMLYSENLKGEQETTQIFRVLHSLCVKQDKTIFLISQGSKEDNSNNKVSIFGSQKANHFTNIMLHLTFDRRKNKRAIEFAKNKQNGYYGITELIFNKNKLILEEKKDIIKKIKKQPTSYKDLNITIEESSHCNHDELKENQMLEDKLSQKGIKFE
jgi:predicted ATP-dependent serine protease